LPPAPRQRRVVSARGGRKRPPVRPRAGRNGACGAGGRRAPAWQATAGGTRRRRAGGDEIGLEAIDQLHAKSIFHPVRDGRGESAVGACQADAALHARGEAERAFDRFYRGTEGGASGLGLALVRRIAELHHGRVRIGAGLDGAGVGFEVDLPVQ
jgi:hypothetical protein